MPVLLDTHALVWLIDGNERLGQQSRQLIDAALRDDLVAVSAISFWEIAMLEARGRLDLSLPVHDWRRRVLAAGVEEISVSGDIGIAAVNLKDFHADPADRIITATAIMHSARLITADTNILSWTGSVECHNASS
ncbi:MAG: type II toxin-antitoxin system VapC family toxin [Chloroflexi bacterium]|nr:type II toxin-antitoxin system VapC family toxin [Chloroflexota bacterium]